MIMPYVTPEASFDPDNITPEVSFDPASDDEVDSSSKLDAIISENTELKTQLFNKQKELEAIANPIMTKMYQGGGGGGMPDMSGMGGHGGASAGGDAKGPHIEEVD